MSSSETDKNNRKGENTEVKQANQTPISIALKAKYSAYTTLIFFLIANPETYKLLQKFLGKWVTFASDGGCPTPVGFFVHTALFFLVLWSFMLFPKDF
jgi:hypothetical protein